MSQPTDNPFPAKLYLNAEPAIANAYLFLLAQSAPHDCGDPECPGFQNKRKLELYDKFQRAIHEFAQAGLLNQCQHEETRNNICGEPQSWHDHSDEELVSMAKLVPSYMLDGQGTILEQMKRFQATCPTKADLIAQKTVGVYVND